VNGAPGACSAEGATREPPWRDCPYAWRLRRGYPCGYRLRPSPPPILDGGEAAARCTESGRVAHQSVERGFFKGKVAESSSSQSGQSSDSDPYDRESCVTTGDLA